MRGKVSWESHGMRMGYVLDKPLPTALPEGSSPEERLTFEKWHDDNRKVRSIILASMTNEIQKQYDRLEDVPSIMLRMKDVYVVPDRHIRYAMAKAIFRTKMAKGPSVHSHGVKMLFLVEKLEDLKAGLNNDTYIDGHSGLGEASTSKVKGKGARRWKRKKGKGTGVTTTASTGGPPPAAPKGKGKGKVGGSQRSKANYVCMHCQGKGYWKRECPQLLSNPGMYVVEVNMISNSASWVLDTGCGAHICNDLQVLERSRRLSKDEMILRLGDGKAVAAEAVGSLHLVVDVCGPLSISARGGFSYFITFTDDHSRYGYVYLMRYKSEAFGRFKEYRLEVENQTNRKIKALRSDRGGEYLSGEFIDNLKENGILSQWTPPGTLQLNGVAERRN
ncbi:UNVERIFIED_CONTAM: hypothetical protein Slati_1473800 [Sesamum latifolium]|uniref:Integrase catalytic domain-containing protein n=1 Tax=Sesamum latifolium TaxID=2727402 RepID=A0AAW2X7I2_9LAMI